LTDLKFSIFNLQKKLFNEARRVIVISNTFDYVKSESVTKKSVS